MDINAEIIIQDLKYKIEELEVENEILKEQIMAYIYYNKELNKYRLFGSLPVMCKTCELDYTHLQYAFRNNNTEYENEVVKIIKVSLERGGKNK